MNIQYCSDLHLEFKNNRDYIKQHPIKPAGEVLILAGDICTLNHLADANDFLSYVSDHFRQVYWVPGNHEYYHGDITSKSDPLYEKVRSNVSLVNHVSVKEGAAELIFSSLWSWIGENRRLSIPTGLNDFKLIRYEGELLSVDLFNELHRRSMEFIRTVVAAGGAAAKVVVTHHVPTYRNYPACYENSILNEAFAVELADFVMASTIHTWIYGHHHHNSPPFLLGDTVMRTNQLGYVHADEHLLFKPQQVFTCDR